MAHPDGVGKEGTEGAVGFGLVQGAEVGVALAVGVEEVRLDEELDPPSPGSRQPMAEVLSVALR